MKFSALLVWSAVLQASAAIPVPFQETFTAAPLKVDWVVDVSQGNVVGATQEGLRIAAAADTYAHIQRPLGVDLIRAASTLKPAGGISWVCSLFLYWDARNWAQVSVLEPEGNYYAVELIDGKLHEYRRPLGAKAEWYRVGIALGEDCIRFQSSSPGGSWVDWLTLERPEPWVGKAPALLILGKGFSRDEGEQHFTAPDLNNDFTDRGPATVSWVRDVSVEPMRAAEVRLIEAEKLRLAAAGRDLLGDAELGADNDPSFASVSRHFPAMKHPREALGVKDGPQDLVVLPNGSLDFAGINASFRVGSPPEALTKEDCARRLYEGYLPIVITSREHDRLNLEQTAFTWSPGFSPDPPLTAFVQLQIRNPGAEDRTTSLEFMASNSVAQWNLKLPSGGDQTVCIRVPFAKPAEAQEITPAEFQEHCDQTAAWWRALLSKGIQIQVPEEQVNQAWRAWLAYNFIDVDKRGSVYEPHDGGGGFYEEVYGYSASRYCYALDLMGYPEEAQRYLDSILTFMKPDGLLVVNYGLPDLGTQLWAMAKHFEITRDDAWLRKAAPAIIKMCDWILAARHSSMASQSKDQPWYGLIKYKPYCDEPTPAYSYHTDTYLALGLREAAAVLREIGMSQDAERLARESRAYEQAILDSMDRAVLQRKGMKMLPVFPETHALLERVGYTGADYYSLVSSMVLETELLPANDRRARWITDLLEQKNGLCLGTCAFEQGIDHAYSYGYWMNCLHRDEVKRVILGLYTSLCYGMSRGTYAGVEVTRLRTGENYPTLPHLYSGTQQLLLLRNMLLQEEGDDLWIGRAIPRPWLAAGKAVRVERAPTLFGKVNFAIRSAEDARSVSVELDPPVTRETKVIHLRLRHPDRRSLSRVTVNGFEHRDFTTDTIALRHLKGHARIQASFK